MKIIRITNDRYIIDAGPDITARKMEEISGYWKWWWEHNETFPQAFVVGGMTIPVEFEDRRESDFEQRISALEAWRSETEAPPEEPSYG